MIKTLYEIGKLIKDKEPDYFNPWQNPYPRADKNLQVIIFNIAKGKLMQIVEREKFSIKRLDKYLYRDLDGPRGTYKVPTLFYYHFVNEEKRSESQQKFLNKAIRCLSDKKVKNAYPAKVNISLLKKDLEELIKTLINIEQGNVLITFKFDGKYIGEIPEFKKIIEEDAYNKYFQKSSALNKVCSLTYKEVDEVWGRVSTLGFTVDDEPFSRNGFDTAKSFKMFPVSPESVKILEGTRKFIESKLSKNFYGLKYFILPHFIEMNEEKKKYILKEFIIKNQQSNPSFTTEVDSIFDNETVIKEITESEMLSQNSVYYDIFFYQINNAQFLIKLHLSDILPSHFQEILETKQKVEKYYKPVTTIYSKKGIEEQTWLYHLTLANIKDFFSEQTQKGIIYHPYFFKIIESIFYGTKLNEHTIVTIFFNRAKEAFKQDKYFESTLKRTLAIYHFFYKLNLFRNNNMETIHTQISLELNEFIKDHQMFFTDETKKAAFFLGCLSEKLMQKQYSKLKSRPLEKYLNGLNIDQTQMKKIHLKLMDKISQYSDMYNKEEHEYNNWLNKEIAPRLIMQSNLSKVDISYAFAIGMVMQKEFNNEYFKKKAQKTE